MARASLVRYIKEHTGTWHDREVASLVSAVLDGTHLTEAHQRWRRTKYHRLAEILAQVSEEKPTGYVASPPPVPTCASAVSVQQLMALP